MANIYCYVDEYGDIGTSHKSSPVFALSGVLVAEEDIFATRELMTNLRADLAQGAKSLHWVKNARNWDRRQHIVDNISQLPVKLIIAIAVKRDLRAPAPLSIQDGAALLWATQLLTERALLAARDWPGGSRYLKLRLSRIRGQSDHQIFDFLTTAGSQSTWVPWNLLKSPVKILNNAELDGLQLADQVCGAFGAAITPGLLSSNLDVSHFAKLYPLIRRSSTGEILNYGIKETSPFVTTLPWWGTLG